MESTSLRKQLCFELLARIAEGPVGGMEKNRVQTVGLVAPGICILFIERLRAAGFGPIVTSDVKNSTSH
jgi:hypothetical protein